MMQAVAAASLAFSAPHFSLTTPGRTIVMQEVAVAPEVEAPPPPPLITTIQVGDKTLAGDAGFDPMQLADSADKLAWYREAEIKVFPAHVPQTVARCTIPRCISAGA